MVDEVNKDNGSIVDFSGKNINETSEDLMNLFLNYPEITELDLSNNLLTKLPLEISFLTCLTKLDIRNNVFVSFEETVKVLTTIKSLSILDIDLIDSDEAMLILNNLPNVQILNGRSTKDEDDEEEEKEEEYDEAENSNIKKETNNNPETSHLSSLNFYNNNVPTSSNNHWNPKMEEIEEVKNLESNSNYVSSDNIYMNNNNEEGSNTNLKENNANFINSISNNNITKNLNNIEKEENSTEVKPANLSDSSKNFKEKNLLKNDNLLEDIEYNLQKINNNGQIEVNNQNKLDKNQNNYLYNKVISPVTDKNNKISGNEWYNNRKIDITMEELDSLKNRDFDIKSAFVFYLDEFLSNMDNLKNQGDSNSNNSSRILYRDNYLNKIIEIENNKNIYPNYLYINHLQRNKIKVLKSMMKEILPLILTKYPELSNNDFFPRLIIELFNVIKGTKHLINILHSHIEQYNNENNKKNNSDEKENKELIKSIEEKNIKISSLESEKERLLQNMKYYKETYEKKIEDLEKENKIMTEKLFQRANTILPSNTLCETSVSFPLSERGLKINTSSCNNININNNIYAQSTIKTSPVEIRIKHQKGCGKSVENLNKNSNYFNNTESNRVNTFSGKLRTPNKALININNHKTLESNKDLIYNNNNNYIDYGKNIKSQIISLKTLKDFINELYNSKSQYDLRCNENKLPKETLEEHMYTYLNKKYGLKNLIIEWAKNIINGIKYYSKKDSYVLLFGKIMRNEQEEEARYIIDKVSDSIDELLLFSIKSQNPFKLYKDIKKLFEEKKKSELLEEEWKGLIHSIYEDDEANEIEKKIENYIAKINENKKAELIFKCQSKIKPNQNLILTTSNSMYNGMSNTLMNNNINTTNSHSYLNSINTNNNKLTRAEKFNLLAIQDENSIPFKDFIKIVLDSHIRFRDRQLKNFVEIFRSVDTNRDGVINEEEFNEMIIKFNIYPEEVVENEIFKLLQKIDNYDNQKITFSECVNFLSNEKILDKNGKEISILEKICFPGQENRESNISRAQMNSIKEEDVKNIKNNSK